MLCVTHALRYVAREMQRWQIFVGWVYLKQPNFKKPNLAT